MKERIDKLDFVKSKDFCVTHCPENEKTSHRLGESICKNLFDEGLFIQNIQELFKT